VAESTLAKRAAKAGQTNEAAWSIIEADRKSAEAKTQRLRVLRLAREEAEAAAKPPTEKKTKTRKTAKQ